MSDHIWEYFSQYEEHERVKNMTTGQMLAEFHTKFNARRNETWVRGSDLEVLATTLINEEHKEFADETVKEDILGELADLVYVCYGYADRFGWDLDEAVRRKHIANLSKLDDTGNPIFREDGKILKGPNYQPADLKDLV